jgi:sugar-specific transcriptional regulator TrmB
MMLKSPNKDLEKKIKILEADLVQCQANISAAERARQFAENEREKLAKKLSNAASEAERERRIAENEREKLAKKLSNAASEAERERRIAENERDELAKKLSNASLALEEKKRLDVRWGRALRFIFVKNIWKIFASQSNCAKMVSKLGILRFIL